MSSPGSPAVSGPKQQLLERAISYLTERGMSDISLRELAAALGTSHRMLIYHFGSKEGLFVEVVREADRRQRQVLADLIGGPPADFADASRRFWRQLRSAELAPLGRLFFELCGQALQGRSYALPVLAGVVDSWIEPLLPALQAAGLSEPQARAQARLGLAVVRGLLLDVLATGDVTGVDEAYDCYLAASAALGNGTGTGSAEGPGDPALPGRRADDHAQDSRSAPPSAPRIR